MRILLIEDEESDATLIRRAFEEASVSNPIDWVRDGKDALDYLTRQGRHLPKRGDPLPGLILLDLKLHKMDGLEILKHIKSNEDLKHIPIVVLTSSSESKDIDEAYHLGANSYLVKPVDYSAFTEMTHQLGQYWLLFNESPNDSE